MTRWRGLMELVEDAIDQGSRAIEEVHGKAGRWAFELLERVPLLAPPVRVVRSVQQTVIARTYRTIRLVNRGIGAVVGMAIDAAEEHSRPAPPDDRPPRR